MNSINGQISIGAPNSEMRYRNATTICADCLERSKAMFTVMPYQVLTVQGLPMISKGQCYVCECKASIAFVQWK